MLVGSVALRTGAPVKSGIVSIVDGGTLDVELFDDVDGTVVLAKTVVLDAGGRLETAVEVGDAVTAVAGLGELEEGAVEVEVPDCARATVASPEQPTKTANTVMSLRFRLNDLPGMCVCVCSSSGMPHSYRGTSTMIACAEPPSRNCRAQYP